MSNATKVSILSTMSFWNKVLEELEIQNISRKELSFRIEVPVSRINRAIERNSMPTILDGLKIADALNVTPFYLLDFKTNDVKKDFNHLSNKQTLLLNSFDKLTTDNQNLVINLINELAKI